MFDRILKQMREKIRTRQYVMTLHAEEEMNDDELTIFDVERGVLAGKIEERQRDRDTNEWKYLIRGKTLNEQDVIVTAKLYNGPVNSDTPNGQNKIEYAPCENVIHRTTKPRAPWRF